MLTSGNTEELNEWFTQFASLSVEITKGCMDYVEQLKTLLNNQPKGRLKSLIKTNDDFTFHIQTGWPKEVDPLSQVKILEYLLKNKTSFLKTKHLSYGPHRANIEYLLNERNENFLSRGEQKKMSIVFWMLQVMILVQNKTKPIVLIDDISS